MPKFKWFRSPRKEEEETKKKSGCVSCFGKGKKKAFAEGENSSKRSDSGRGELPKIWPEDSSTSISLTGINAPQYSLTELMTATDNFNRRHIIGRGGFGPVYRCNLDGQDVAVKVLKQDSKQGINEFKQELEFLSNFHHPNLVKLVGYCYKGCLAVIYELLERGSLDEHIHDSSKRPMDWKTRVTVAIGVAKSIQYLHDEDLIHADIKPANILLDNEYNPKLSDFGTIMSATAVPVDTKIDVVTWGYVDPEFSRTGEMTRMYDVYSFGVLVLELISGREAIEILSVDGIEKKRGLGLWAAEPLARGELTEFIDPRIPVVPKLGSAAVLGVVARCLRDEPYDRPSITEVVTLLSNCLEIVETAGGEAGPSSSTPTTEEQKGI